MFCLSFDLQKLKPEYSKAATSLNEHDSTIVIGKVRIYINRLTWNLTTPAVAHADQHQACILPHPTWVLTDPAGCGLETAAYTLHLHC